MSPFFWLVLFIFLSPFIASIASIIIWKKNKNPSSTLQRGLYKYRKGCGILLIIFALFSFFKSYDSNAEPERYYTWIALLILILIVGYLLFRNYVPTKKTK